MRLISCILAVGISLVYFSHPLLAAEQAQSTTLQLYPVNALTCPKALLRGCCVTYCPRPTPGIRCFCQACSPVTYCKKPCPLVPHYSGGCGIAYCPKPCPDLCRPLAADAFACVPGTCRPTGPTTCANTSCSSPVSASLNEPIENTEINPVPLPPPLPH